MSFAKFHITTSNMREYGFSPTRLLPSNDKIVDSALTRENMGQRKPVVFVFYPVHF